MKMQIDIRTPDTQCAVVEYCEDVVPIDDLTSLYFRVCIGLGYTAGSIKDSFANFNDEQGVA
jgi:hypothetical protein